MDQNGLLEQRIVDLFSAHFHTDVADLGADLLATGVVDSVRLVELVLELEQRFDLALPFDELEIDDFRTVHRIAALVARMKNGGHPPAPQEIR